MAGRDLPLTLSMFAAMAAGMAGFFSFPTLLPEFKEAWDLTATEAGWISGVFSAGYVVTVPLVTALTDRVNPRTVFICGMLLLAAATAGFGLGADGVASATVWRILQGAGFAATYMPGLKAVSDLVAPAGRDRAIAFYTATFTVGSGVSILATGLLAAALDWRSVFVCLALGPLVGMAIAALALPRGLSPTGGGLSNLSRFRLALRERPSVGYMIAYAAHNAESATLRAWGVALLAVAAGAGTGDIATTVEIAVIATVANLAGLPGAVIGNEAARAGSRRTVVAAVMVASGLLGIAIGFALAGAFLLVVALLWIYGFLVPADAGAINAGLVAATPPEARGAALGVHALLGFTGAFVGPVLFGAALDLGGGAWDPSAWPLAFAVLLGLSLAGAGCLIRLTRSAPRRID